MLTIKKKPQRYVTVTEKMAILENIGQKKAFDLWQRKYSAFQMQELRDFLMNYLRQYHEKIKQEKFDPAGVLSKMVSIQNYFHNQDCRETIDACQKETCLGSDPSCFSSKMKGQITVILDEIYSLSPNVKK